MSNPNTLDPLRVAPALAQPRDPLNRDALRPIGPASAAAEIALGTLASCPDCGEERERRRTEPNAKGKTIDYWSDCACTARLRDRDMAIVTGALREGAGPRSGDNRDDGAAYDIRTLAESYAADPYDPTLLDPAIWDDCLQWLRQAHAQNVVFGYRHGQPAAIYLQGLRGRGKTRTAIELALDANRLGRRVAIVNEKKYLHQLSGTAFGPAYEALVAEPAERAWLTIVDDIGKHKPTSDADRDRVMNAWYTLLDRRYNRRRWTIFTSELTLDQLVQQGTIDDSMYGRLYEMTRGIVVQFDGVDLRLRG